MPEESVEIKKNDSLEKVTDYKYLDYKISRTDTNSWPAWRF